MKRSTKLQTRYNRLKDETLEAIRHVVREQGEGRLQKELDLSEMGRTPVLTVTGDTSRTISVTLISVVERTARGKAGRLTFFVNEQIEGGVGEGDTEDYDEENFQSEAGLSGLLAVLSEIER